jgi:hypothetical protein
MQMFAARMASSTPKGPIFKKEIEYQTGERVFKEYLAPKNSDDTCLPAAGENPKNGFWYIDLLAI